MRFKHVIFDVDGTLYDSLNASITPLDELLTKMGRSPLTQEQRRIVAGMPAAPTLDYLDIPQDIRADFSKKWFDGISRYASEVKLFPEVRAVLSFLKDAGVKLGVVTSRTRDAEKLIGDVGSVVPMDIAPFIGASVSADEVDNPKPAPDSLLRYMQLTGAQREEILYVGDTLSDLNCAKQAGIAFGYALWGSLPRENPRADYCFLNPWEIVNVALTDRRSSSLIEKWALEIQAIGQIGLTYVKDDFDRERFARLRELSCEMLAAGTNEDIDILKDALCFDKGYITPKLDTRAAIFNEQHEILLVQEKSGKWSLPGGWCDDGLTIFENVKKEVREEACMEVVPVKLIAITDRNRHHKPAHPYGVLKATVHCLPGRGDFTPNIETIDRKYFRKENIPVDDLRTGTTNMELIEMCFAYHESTKWDPIVE